MADPIVNVTTRVFNIEVTKKENQVVISSPGPQGPVGVGFPIGGTAGQFLTKIDGTNYNTQWITLPSYQPLDSDLTGIAALSQNGLLRKTSGTWVMDSTTYLVASDLSPYLTITSAAATYSPLTHNHNGVYQPVGNYLTSYTETDPIFLASPAYTITSQQIANWNNPTVFPSQSGNNGKFLTTNGSITSWATVDALPSQSGNNGKYLTTNGLSASWGILDLSLYLTTANAASTYQPIGNYLTSYNETDTLSSVTGRGSSTGSAISITNTTQSTSYSTGSLIVGGGVGIAKDLFVQGNLVLTGNIDINGTITGNLTQINVTDLNVTDSLIYLGSENLTSDTLDIGFNGAYRPLGDISGHKHTGFARDHNDSGIWKLFSGAAEITGNDIDFGLNDVNVNFDQLKIRSLIVTDASTTRTNLGLGTMAVENASNYLTTSTASSTYLTQANASTTYAPVSNPLFLTAISFEGATPDANETHLTVVDPTADRIITLPDDTGTVALTKDTAKLASANAFTVGGHEIKNNSDVVALTVKPNSTTQTANLIELKTNNNASTLALFDQYGSAAIGGNNTLGSSLGVQTAGSTTQKGVTIRGASSQIADLLQIQNSTPTVLGGHNAVAQTYTGSTTPIFSSIGTVYSVQINSATEGQINFVAATNLAAGDIITVAAASGTSIIPAATYVVPVGGVLNSGTVNASYVKVTLVGATITAATTTASSLPASVTAPAQASITARSAGTKALIVKGATSQTANIQEWQTPAGNPVSSVLSDGRFAIVTYGGAFGAAGLSVGSTGPYAISTAIRGTAGQSSDLVQYSQSNGTVYGGIGAGGQMYSGRTSPANQSLPSPIAISTSVQTASTTVTYTTANNHGLAVGQFVTVYNSNQSTHNISGTIQTVPANNQFTLTAAASNTLNGTTANIAAVAIVSSVQTASTTVTYTTANNHGLAVGQYITILATSQSGHNIVGTITSVPAVNQFIMISATNTTLTGAGGYVSSNATQTYLQSNSFYSAALGLRAAASRSYSISASDGTSGLRIVYTTSSQTATNGISVGDTVAVTGSSNANHIGTFTVIASTSTTFTVASTVGGSGTGGTATVTQYSAPFYVENSAGSTVAYIDSVGGARLNSIANINAFSNAFLYPQTTGWLLGASGTTASIPLKIQNANAGTVTGDLTQWLNNSGSAIAKIDASGNITAGSMTNGYAISTGNGTYTVLSTTTFLECSGTPNVVLTLPTSTAGRSIWIRNNTGSTGTVTSNAANIIQKTGGAATSAICPGTFGSFAFLVYNGANWQIMQTG